VQRLLFSRPDGVDRDTPTYQHFLTPPKSFDIILSIEVLALLPTLSNQVLVIAKIHLYFPLDIKKIECDFIQ
jgi:hypothetical protein